MIYPLALVLSAYVALSLFVLEGDGIAFIMGRAHTGDMVSMPTPHHVRRSIVDVVVREISNLSASTFVDFGCGQGAVLRDMAGRVSLAVGVELDRAQAEATRIGLAGARAVRVYRMDMRNYTYGPGPTILYMYEPLWLMPRAAARQLYAEIIGGGNGARVGHILYVGSLHDPHLDPDFFLAYGFRQVTMVHLPRILLPIGGWSPFVAQSRLYLFVRADRE